MEMEYPGSSVEDVRWQDAPEYFEQRKSHWYCNTIIGFILC